MALIDSGTRVRLIGDTLYKEPGEHIQVRMCNNRIFFEESRNIYVKGSTLKSSLKKIHQKRIELLVTTIEISVYQAWSSYIIVIIAY